MLLICEEIRSWTHIPIVEPEEVPVKPVFSGICTLYGQVSWLLLDQRVIAFQALPEQHIMASNAFDDGIARRREALFRIH